MENWKQILIEERIETMLCMLITFVAYIITKICFSKIRWTKQKKIITHIAGVVLLVGVFALSYFGMIGKNILESCIAAVIVGFSLTACFPLEPKKNRWQKK